MLDSRSLAATLSSAIVPLRVKSKDRPKARRRGDEKSANEAAEIFLSPASVHLTRPIVLLLRLVALPVVEGTEAEPEREDPGEEEAAAQRTQDLPAPQRHKSASRRSPIWTGQRQGRHHLQEAKSNIECAVSEV